MSLRALGDLNRYWAAELKSPEEAAAKALLLPQRRAPDAIPAEAVSRRVSR